jgi:hypothetical protein
MRSTFTRWWLAAMTALVVVAPVMPGQALGAASPSAATEAKFVDPAVASLAREYHLPIAEAEARIAWQHRAGDLQPTVEARMGERFGGMWISQANGGRIRLGVAGDPAAIPLAHRVLDELDLGGVTDVVPVKRSMRDLVAARDAVIAELRRQYGARWQDAGAGAGIRTSTNSVTVSLPPSAFGGLASTAVAARLTRSLGDAITVDYTAVPIKASACNHPYCDPPLRAGVSIGNTKSQCTAGFPARSRADNALYIMTAGHCGLSDPDLPWRSYFSDHETYRWIGKTLEHRRIYGDGNGDAQIIRVNDNDVWKTRAWVFVRNGEDTVRDTDYPIKSDGTAMEDDRVCMSGRSSGTDCGTVLSVQQCRTYFDPPAWVCGLTVANYGSTDGDSGGPIFSFHKAFGLHSGRNPVTGNAFFFPVRVAEDRTNVDISFDGG